MLGSRLQFGNVRGEDRFYIPVKARKRCNNQQKQARRASKNDANESPKEHQNSSEKPSFERSLTPTSNLDRLLEFTTPSVPAQYFSKTTMRGRRTCDVEFEPYFTLNDLWESFREWSAYGAGVPLVLNNCDSVIQYYVPYLSGIQLYGESSVKSNAKSRQVGEDNDVDNYLDSSSDASSDYEFEKHTKVAKEQGILHHLSRDIRTRMGSLSIHGEHPVLQEGFSSDDGEAGNSRGVLLFEFLEQDAPYGREPLADKISGLAHQYPGLKTLRSCDLLPGSWMSVAWYPIYRIPTGPTLKDLDACFLTYHSLSTSMTAPHMTSLNFNNIETLTGSNYKKWKEDVEMVIGLMDLDLALREEKPAAITAESTADHKAKVEKWERTNRMSLMIMRKAMAPSVKGGVPKQDNAKDFLAAVGEKFKESDKAETGTFLTQITSMKFDGEGSVREHILKMVDLAQKLKDLEVPMTDQFLVHMALNSLPSKYGQLKVSYNTQKVKWGIDELITMCAQEEDRLRSDKSVDVNFVQGEKRKRDSAQGSTMAAGKKKKKEISSSFKNANIISKGSYKIKTANVETEKEKECYFCKETGHLRKNCNGFKNWLVKKGLLKNKGDKQ